MRAFNPAAVWTQVGLASKTARVVKSVQYGSISFTGTNVVSGTATITSVGTDRTVVIPTGGSQSPAEGAFATRLTLTNATTVTATTNNDNGAGRTYLTGFVVVEFY